MLFNDDKWPCVKIAAHRERDNERLVNGKHRITSNICQEIYNVGIKEKKYKHEAFLAKFKHIIDKDIQPVIIAHIGYKPTWFEKILVLGWNFAGRVH